MIYIKKHFKPLKKKEAQKNRLFLMQSKMNEIPKLKLQKQNKRKANLKNLNNFSLPSGVRKPLKKKLEVLQNDI